ncbi:endolytic transglycosylase MltG [Streptosporangium carneum]|uniref:endolytic transglycosylase MltG n=1 Tax=Streptosporangium carneum TaxID=47481 RepID=UPI0031E97939
MEGFLFSGTYEFFSGTYEFSPTSSPDEILAAMVTRFKRAAEDSDLVDVARRVGRTPLEIMTIASIVQAESTDKRDMPKIARVWRQARGARDAALLDP